MDRLRPILRVSLAVISFGVCGGFILWQSPSVAKELSSEEIMTLPYAEVESQITSQHPAMYMAYAGRVFHNKSKEEGAFWFYVGQLRYRFHLAANPDLEPSGDPALFASLMSVAGQPINKFAGSDPNSWIDTIDKALAWDAANDNGFTSKEKYKDKYDDIRAGLEKLKVSISENKQQILDRDKMPKDWPALVNLESVKGLEGDYSTESFFLLAIWLFGNELTDEMRDRTDVVRIVQESDTSIFVIAIAEGKEIGRRTIALDEADEGYSFTTKQTAEEWGFHEGGSTTVITLLRNTEGNLILKWVFTLSAKKTSDSPTIEDLSVSWERALESSNKDSVDLPSADDPLPASRP